MTKTIHLKATNLFCGLFFIIFVFYIGFLPVVHGLITEDIFYKKHLAQFHQLIAPIQNIYHGKSEPSGISIDSGYKCLACVIVVRIVEQYAIKEEKPSQKVIDEICDIFPNSSPLQDTCQLLMHLTGKYIAKYLNDGHHIDTICHKINACENPSCRLYGNNGFNQYFLKKNSFTKNHLIGTTLKKELSSIEFESKLKNSKSFWERLKEVYTDHLPFSDPDKDDYSTDFGLRGTAWRGKDCDPTDGQIYPGRKNGSLAIRGSDYNCNGIYGVNGATGKTYKEELCPSSAIHRGVAVIGDSVGARFRIPENFFEAKELGADIFLKIPEMLENEFDFPHLGWCTGYDEKNRDHVVLPDDFETSVYHEMWKIDHCIHRDFQNLGVNGYTSNELDKVIPLLKRDQKNDNPLTLIIEYVGNDVCVNIKPYPKYTPVDTFYNNIVNGLHLLDEKLPPNSYILFVGVADGRFLFDALHDKIHPTGTPYPQFYDFLSCLGKNPCESWLNSNKTIRDQTTAHAKKLNEQYSRIISEYQGKFKNFKMFYMENPVIEIIEEYVAKGGNAQDLIEPVDGFHPSQKMQATVAKRLIAATTKVFPDAFGEVNPNNEKIESIFGNQGGF